MIDRDTEEMEKVIQENGYFHARVFNNGMIGAILPMIFTVAIVLMNKSNIREGYEDRWCYKKLEDALKALDEWDGTGEPSGWHRHPFSGRRRENGKEKVWF